MAPGSVGALPVKTWRSVPGGGTAWTGRPLFPSQISLKRTRCLLNCFQNFLNGPWHTSPRYVSIGVYIDGVHTVAWYRLLLDCAHNVAEYYFVRLFCSTCLDYFVRLFCSTVLFDCFVRLFFFTILFDCFVRQATLRDLMSGYARRPAAKSLKAPRKRMPVMNPPKKGARVTT
jgi:hypothetical protein